MPAPRCAYCGKELARSIDTCGNCGATVQPPDPQQQNQEPPPPQGVASAALNAPPAPVGARVMARWMDRLWYPGVVDGERGPSQHVTFDDGDQSWVGPQDLTTQQDLADEGSARFAMGSKIRGRWPDGKWYDGVIDDRFGRVWHVKFDDGDQAWLDTTRLQAGSAESKFAMLLGVGFVSILILVGLVLAWAYVTTSAEEAAQYAPSSNVVLMPLVAPPVVGAPVLAPFESGLYYFLGTVAALPGNGLVDVAFLDGDRRAVPIANLRQDTIGPGMSVSARAASLGDGWWGGTIRVRNGNTLQVAFDNGTTDWINLAQTRIAVAQ